MKQVDKITSLIKKIPEKKIIFAREVFEKLTKEDKKISSENFYKVLERLVTSGELTRLSKGIYARPKKTRFGVILPNSKEIVEVFIEKEKGMMVGYHLYNKLKLTTQIPKKYRVFTRDTHKKSTIQQVVLKEYKLKYTEEIQKMISMLEVLSNVETIQDLNEKQFVSYCKEFAINVYNDQIMEKVVKEIGYKKKTLYFLKTILDAYQISNSIHTKLSKTSKYKVPEVEYYETA